MILVARERGSASVGLALAALVLLLTLGIAGSGMIVATYAAAATAADAAALGSAPVTFHHFGAEGSPTDEAARLARANGARLVSCRCRLDPTWRQRTVEVTVERSVVVPWGQTMRIRATSRATFDPSLLLQPDRR